MGARIRYTAISAVIGATCWFASVGCWSSTSSSAQATDDRAGSPGGSSDEQTDEEKSTPDAEDRPGDTEPVLEQHAWEHRPVVVFAPSDEAPAYRRQNELFSSHRARLAEREISLYRVFREGTSRGPTGDLSDAAERRLRRRFEPGDGLTVVLVGLDTTEKLRTDGVLEAEKLFETIDAMPIRQREMNDE